MQSVRTIPRSAQENLDFRQNCILIVKQVMLLGCDQVGNFTAAKLTAQVRKRVQPILIDTLTYVVGFGSVKLETDPNFPDQ